MPDLKSTEPAFDLGELLSELATKIERVKQLYEQYFMGIEKMEPQVARKEVARALLQLQQQQIRNTGLRFKFNTMLQKWNIYITYWNRTLREIDAGTYIKHVAKARRAAEREGKVLPDEIVRKPGRTPTHGELPAVAARAPSLVPNAAAPSATASAPATGATSPPPLPGRSSPPPIPAAPGATRTPSSLSPPPTPLFGAPAPAPKRPAPLPSPAIPGMSEPDLRALHKKYVDARRSTGEAAQVSYETLINSLAKQAPRILEQPGVRGVRFDVAVQNGKAILKAIPQK